METPKQDVSSKEDINIEIKQKIPDTYQRDIEYVKKGDNDIMQNIENGPNIPEIKTNIVEFSFIVGVRKNIQNKINKLEKTVFLLNTFNWFLFSLSILCMGLITIGLNTELTTNLNLVQIFGAISILAKSIEKSSGFDKIAKKKQTIAHDMRGLLREISVIELLFYSEFITPQEVKTSLYKVRTIWKSYDDLENKTLIQPNDLVENVYTEKIKENEKSQND